MLAEDMTVARYARAMSAIAQEARARGWSDPSGLAVTVAQMLALATMAPVSDPGRRLLDRSFELSSVEWQRILAEVTKNDQRLQPLLGAFSSVPDHQHASFPPGLIDSVRRHLLDAITFDMDDASWPGAAPPLLLQAVLEVARDHHRGAFAGLSRKTQLFVADALAVRAGERVYCATAGAAGLALHMAGERGAVVTLELSESSVALLCAWLAAAGRFKLDIRVSPALLRADAPSTPRQVIAHDDAKYDLAVLYAPFGEMRARGITDDALRNLGLPPATSLDGLYAMLAATMATRSACIAPNGFLFRTTRAEQLLKERLIRLHSLDAVISLPRDALGRQSGVQASILLFHSNNQSQSSHHVLMVDARASTEMAAEQSGAADWHKQALQALGERDETEISAAASLGQIAENDFNITVERYVLDPVARRARDLLSQATPLEKLAELYRPQALGPSRTRDLPEQITAAYFGLAPDFLEVGVTDIDEAGIVRNPIKQVMATPEVMQRSRRSRLESGDILLVIKGSVGKVGFVRHIPERATWLASQSFVIVRLNRQGPISDPLVLFRFLASEIGQSAIRNLAVGAIIPALQMADVRRLPILIPPRATQAAILRDLRKLLELQDRIVEMRDEFSARLRIMWPDECQVDQERT